MSKLWVKPVIILVVLLGAGTVQAMQQHYVSSSNKEDSFIAPVASAPLPTSYTQVQADIPATTPTPATTPSGESTLLEGAQAASEVVSSPVPTSVATSTPNPTNQPLSATVGYSVDQGSVYSNGQTITLHGVNWFGFDTTAHVVHGLWDRNWSEMITQMKSLGFNAVRLPICPVSLHDAAVDTSTINYTLNPDLQGLTSTQILDKVMNELNKQNMYILLDQHRFDCQTISDLWYTPQYSESAWISDLTLMAQKYKDLPYFMGIDLKNEPQGIATWGTGDVTTDWNLAAERAGSAVLKTNPSLLIFIEGVQNSKSCSSQTVHWWGGNLGPANCTAISQASIPYNKVVLSPHVYGPDVYSQDYFSTTTFPANMPSIWNADFGSLADKGYTVIPGEWGGWYGTTNKGTAKDVLWQNALVSYYQDKSICSSFYWDWNADSSDTGGILQDDWQTPWQSKINLLHSYWATCR